MALQKCNDCGHPTSSHATRCPCCGNTHMGATRGYAFMIAMGMTIVWLIVLYAVLYNGRVDLLNPVERKQLLYTFAFFAGVPLYCWVRYILLFR